MNGKLIVVSAVIIWKVKPDGFAVIVSSTEPASRTAYRVLVS